MPWHPFHNVVRMRADGEVCWRAALVSAEPAAKCWLGVSYDGALRAWTYSWECELDLASGRIVAATFTK